MQTKLLQVHSLETYSAMINSNGACAWVHVENRRARGTRRRAGTLPGGLRNQT